LEYTNILSPVDGIVIDRKIDPGQTLAATFQTPQLFTVAPDMRKKMHVHALVDEAEIGAIREAQAKGRPVHFTVDAYSDDLFEGKIEEVRYSATTTQNVVNYPVVVAAPNPDLKLLPGMTASISFQIEERDRVLKIPNAALRYFPLPEHVRAEDRKLLEGTAKPDEEDQDASIVLSAAERAEVRRKRNRRYVWIVDGELLRAVEVVTGLSDNRYTELVSGNLKTGQKLVTGMEPKKLF
jgi:HlyD family secretion protein